MMSARSRLARLTTSLGLTAILLVVGAALALAHDMFLKPERYFVEENAEVVVRLLNGTFTKSENAVVRRRLRDLSVLSPAGRAAIDTTQWHDSGDTSWVALRTGAAGTYIVGTSTHPSTIRLVAKDFNHYLAEDGIPDMLAERKRTGTLDQPAHERYSKHVKALIQVGATPSPRVDTEFGYAAELLPLDNPYASPRPGALKLKALVDGKPVVNQLVVAGGRGTSGAGLPVLNLRTDADGVVRVPLTPRGTWYAKFIHMVRVAGDSVNHESKWASLTWQVR